jgi:hypothetical protein
MQNSLERIFEGLCATLRDVILPEVSDPWVQIQVEAAAGVLSNLAVRVEWRCRDLADEVSATRAVLAAATAVDRSAPELADAREVLADDAAGDRDHARLLETRAAHLEALAGVQAWAAGRTDAATTPVRDALRRLLADRLEAELALLARARRPPPSETAASRAPRSAREMPA